jgi:hypothetical protein
LLSLEELDAKRLLRLRYPAHNRGLIDAELARSRKG